MRSKGRSAAFSVKDPVLWNAEEPYQYTLKLRTPEEILVQKVGIRTISIKDGVVLINERPVKFKGVNRHDSSLIPAQWYPAWTPCLTCVS